MISIPPADRKSIQESIQIAAMLGMNRQELVAQLMKEFKCAGMTAGDMLNAILQEPPMHKHFERFGGYK